MAKAIRQGRYDLILNFVRLYTAEHGFGPTMREIAVAVGLRSTSTVADYLLKMQKAGLVSSIPGSARSIRVLDQADKPDQDADGCTVLQCKFKCPAGTIPREVYLVVGEGASTNTVHCPGEIVACVSGRT